MQELRARWTQTLARRTTQARTWWAGRATRERRAIVGAGGGILVGLLVGIVVVAASGGGDSAPPDDEGPAVVVVVTGTPSATATPGAVSAHPCAGLQALPWECGDDEQFLASQPREPVIPTVGSIGELHEGYGEPPGATLGRVRIPVIGIDAPLGASAVGGDGVMRTPAGPSDIVWYDFSGFGDAVGGAPGAGRNAVYSGHVDYSAIVPYAGINYRGGGVFRNINLLSPGDVIEVLVNGQTLTYTVVWRRQVTADTTETNWNEILTANVPVDSVTLITCGGDFNTTERSYLDRVVVRAVRA